MNYRASSSSASAGAHSWSLLLPVKAVRPMCGVQEPKRAGSDVGYYALSGRTSSGVGLIDSDRDPAVHHSDQAGLKGISPQCPR